MGSFSALKSVSIVINFKRQLKVVFFSVSLRLQVVVWCACLCLLISNDWAWQNEILIRVPQYGTRGVSSRQQGDRQTGSQRGTHYAYCACIPFSFRWSSRPNQHSFYLSLITLDWPQTQLWQAHHTPFFLQSFDSDLRSAGKKLSFSFFRRTGDGICSRSYIIFCYIQDEALFGIKCWSLDKSVIAATPLSRNCPSCFIVVS